MSGKGPFRTKKPEKSDKRAILSGLGAIFLWCWSGICFRKGSEIMGSSMVYLTFMSGGGALTALVFQHFRGLSVSDSFRLPFRVMVAGFFGVALYTVILAAAFGMADVRDIGQINLLNYLWPVWMVLLGIVWLGERPRAALAVIGILMGFAGVILSRGPDFFTHPPTSLVPHTMAFSGGLLWAVYVVLLKKWKIPEEKGGTAFHFLMCALMAGALAWGRGEWAIPPGWSWEMVFWVVFGAAGPVGIAYSLYEISVKHGPVLLIASFSYFIPIGSTLFIGLIFEETMNAGLPAGAVLITLGAWMVGRSTRIALPNP